MFAGKSIFQIFQMGGFTMYALLLCSILCVAVIINRFLYYRKTSKVKREEFFDVIYRYMDQKDIKSALDFCKRTESLFSGIAYTVLNLGNKDVKLISNAIDREITIKRIDLEKYTSIVGTIANVAVYLGLLGTSIGIIRAFSSIAEAGAGGVAVVIGGVSEALIATASGLCIAVPAVVAYNYFVKRVDDFSSEMELFSSELTDLLCGEKQ